MSEAETTGSAATEALAGVDLHTHLMPGVDDGARDLDDAAEALSKLRQQRVGTAAATPHFPASLLGRPERLEQRFRDLDDAWERLVDLRDERFSDLELLRGVELRLDQPEPDLSDDRLRLGGTDWALVEFSHFQVPSYGARQLSELVEAGWRPLLAHPERYIGIRQSMEDAVPAWREAGAVFQVNAGSLTGRYGPTARQAALEMLRRGWADVLSSDYHARGEPGLDEARQRLEELGGSEQAELLFETNPRRVVEGRATFPVEPLEGVRSLWREIRGWLG